MENNSRKQQEKCEQTELETIVSPFSFHGTERTNVFFHGGIRKMPIIPGCRKLCCSRPGWKL